MGNPGITLPHSQHVWPGETFADTLKAEIEALPAGSLPLDAATLNGWHIDDSHITATVLHTRDDAAVITAAVGIFFAEIIAGCSCGDEPQSQSNYCELQVIINKGSGSATFAVPETPT